MTRPDWKRPANGQSGARVAISLPAALLQRLRRQGRSINVNQIAADALRCEVERIEMAQAEDVAQR